MALLVYCKIILITTQNNMGYVHHVDICLCAGGPMIMLLDTYSQVKNLSHNGSSVREHK